MQWLSALHHGKLVFDLNENSVFDLYENSARYALVS